MSKEEEYRKKYVEKINDLRHYSIILFDEEAEEWKSGFSDYRYNSIKEKREKVKAQIEELLKISDNPEAITKWGQEQEIKEAEAKKRYEEAKAKHDSKSAMGNFRQRLKTLFTAVDTSKDIEEGRSR